MARTPHFPPLSEVTRPGITTEEIAYYTNTRPQTWRVHACRQTGGIRPRKIGGKLFWPTDAVRALVEGK